MPWSAPRHCPHGHPPFTGRRCPACAAAFKVASDARRPSARARGYTAEWYRESRAFLRLPENRLCACACGRAADMVDHRIAHKGDQRLFWDRSNWQPMARGCNSRKAIREEGAFGNPVGGGVRASIAPRQDRPPGLARNFPGNAKLGSAP
jgi:5-methylcytosine-specific restriction protein A